MHRTPPQKLTHPSTDERSTKFAPKNDGHQLHGIIMIDSAWIHATMGLTKCKINQHQRPATPIEPYKKMYYCSATRTPEEPLIWIKIKGLIKCPSYLPIFSTSIFFGRIEATITFKKQMHAEGGSAVPSIKWYRKALIAQIIKTQHDVHLSVGCPSSGSLLRFFDLSSNVCRSVTTN